MTMTDTTTTADANGSTIVFNRCYYKLSCQTCNHKLLNLPFPLKQTRYLIPISWLLFVFKEVIV